MLASSASAFRPWIALRSCASSREYSAFECSGLSGYSDFLDRECHLVEGIAPVPQVLQQSPYAYPDQRCMVRGSVDAVATGFRTAGLSPAVTSSTKPAEGSENPVGEVESCILTRECGICFVEECLCSTLVGVAERIAKISPVGPDIG